MRTLATVLAIGAVALVAAGCGIGSHAAAPIRLATTTVSAVKFAYPTTFHIRRFSSCDPNLTGDQHGACIHGVMVASYSLRAQPEEGARGARFQKRGVAFELYRQPAGQKANGVPLRDRSLALWPFQPPVTSENGPTGETAPPPPEEYSTSLRVNGVGYSALAWVGTDATADKRHALAGLIKSVHAVGVTPHEALPLPPPAVLHVLCAGSLGSPRMPSTTLTGAGGSTCTQVTGSRCRAFTQESPRSAIRERHYHLAAFICAYTRRFLIEHPRGYVVEPRPPGLVLR